MDEAVPAYQATQLSAILYDTSSPREREAFSKELDSCTFVICPENAEHSPKQLDSSNRVAIDKNTRIMLERYT